MKSTEREKLIQSIKQVLEEHKFTGVFNPDLFGKDEKRLVADNYYGELPNIRLGGLDVEIESIWEDKGNNINLHCGCEEFEGDLLLFSLPDKKIEKVLKGLIKYYEEED